MNFVLFGLIGVGGVIVLWLIFRFLAGCVVKLLLAVAVLAAAGLLIYLILSR